MSELPAFAQSNNGGLLSIEQQEALMNQLIDHSNDHIVTALTNMIDQAAKDVIMCRDYLTHHPIEQEVSAMTFLDDAVRALSLSKSLAQNGYEAGPFLASISLEMERTKEELLQNHPSPNELLISEYLDSAIHDIQISRHLEKMSMNGIEENKEEDNETAEDDITIINPTQPYTFKDGRYMVVGSPVLMSN